MSLHTNMFRSSVFLAKEFGKIDQRNAIIHIKEQECLEKYINTFIKEEVLVKTADNIKARKIIISTRPEAITLYFVTGISVDIFTINANKAHDIYCKAGIIKMNTVYGETYIILEDLFYTIFAHPYSRLNENLDIEITDEEEDRLIRQYWALNNFEQFIKYIGIKLGWPIVPNKDQHYIEIPTDIVFRVNTLYSRLNIDYANCLFIEMMREILYAIHRPHYKSDQEFEDKLILPFVYSYMHEAKDVFNNFDKELKLDYSKLLISIAKKIAELGETSDVDDIGYATAWINLFNFSLDKAAEISLKVLERINKEEKQKDE